MPDIHTLLSPVDFSDASDHALGYAIDLASKLGARVAPQLTVVMLPLPLLVAASAWVDVLGAWVQPKRAGGP